MKDIEIIDIDYSAVDESYKRKETIKLTETSSPFIVPEEGPYYKRSLIVMSGSTALIPNKDFFYEEPLEEMELMLGKGVYLYLRLSDQSINDLKEVTITYQKVGTLMVGRKKLLELLENAIYNNRDIDWDTQVHGKPATFYPAYHRHDIQNELELVGFGDLMKIVIAATKDVERSGLDIYNELTKIKDECYKRLNSIYETRWKQLFDHVQNTNKPHKTTKKDLLLDKHPNWKTATKLQDMTGEPDDVISTPMGLKAAIDDYDVDTDSYIRQGATPFTSYAAGFYIPPPITGSFEGLGASDEYCGFCMEPNGYLVGLVQGYDGKSRSLYYLYNRNIRDTSSKWINSYYKYQNSSLPSNFNPNIIIRGSGSKVIAVGDAYNPTKLYVSLSNGSFDTAMHTYREVDTTVIANTAGRNLANLTIGKVGNKIYLIQSVSNMNGDSLARTDLVRNEWGTGVDLTNYQQYFYEFNLNELTSASKTPIQPKHILLNYENLEKTFRTNETAFRLARVDGTARDKITQYIFKYDKPVKYAMSHRERQIIIVEDVNNPTQAILKMIVVNYYAWENSDGSSGSTWRDFCVNYYFDTTTNTLKIDPKWKMPITSSFSNISNFTQAELNYFGVNQLSSSGVHPFRGAYDHAGISWVDGLGIATSGINERALPYRISVKEFGYVGETEYQRAKYGWIDSEIRFLRNRENVTMDSPFGPSSNLRMFSNIYSYNGKTNTLPIELFRSEDKNGNSKIWTREASDDKYSLNPNLKILSYPDYECYLREPNTKYKIANFINYAGRCNTNSKDKTSLHHSVVYVNERFNDAGDFVSRTSSVDFLNRYTQSATSLDFLIYCNYTYNENGLTATEQLKYTLSMSERNKLIDDMTGNLYTSKGLKQYNLVIYLPPAELKAKGVKGVAIIHFMKRSHLAQTFMTACTFDYDLNGTALILKTFEYPLKYVSHDSGDVPSHDLIKNPQTPVRPSEILTNGYWYSERNPGNTSYSFSGSFVCLDVTSNGNYKFTLTDASIEGTFFEMTVTNNIVTDSKYRLTGIRAPVYGNKQYCLVNGVGIYPCTLHAASGGAINMGIDTTNKRLYLLSASFFEGNWSIIVTSSVEGMFNGQVKSFPQWQTDLRSLNVPYQNTTFYLYAVCGKTEGKYELTNSLKTTSPYHALVATIETDASGITTIETQTVFGLNGFNIDVVRTGGIIPASSGVPTEKGSFKTIKQKDLFDYDAYLK